ncbi:MAG: AMP-binding protein [Fibrobacter sp.]|nr:AMP-binding protein [Fibrobacter sp.]
MSKPLSFPSLPALFLANTEREHFQGWYQRKNNEWIHFSRESLKKNLFQLSLAFQNRGLCKRSSIGIVAPTSPQWLLADVAAQVCSTAVVPLFPDISPQNFAHQCDDAQVDFLIADRLDALNESLRVQLKRFKLIICIHPEQELPENGIFWDTLLQEGARLSEEPGAYRAFEKKVESIRPEDIFSIIYTSGSTGTPKGAALSHRNMISQLESILKRLPVTKEDSSLTMLPVAHVFERMALYYYIMTGMKVYFADDAKNAAVLLKETHPSVMTTVPRVLEKLYEGMTAAADKAWGPQKWLIQKSIKTAQTLDPKKPSILRKIFEKLVYPKMRAAIGDNFKYIISGSSAINKNVLQFLLNIGLPVYEGYGLTECTPVISVNNHEHWKLGSVGKVLEHLSVKIDPKNSDILVKGDSVFSGYLHLPELNQESFTADGYFKTGDEGYLDEDGFLFLTGRLKEILKTSTGKYISPLPIELKLTHHPLIEAALIIANERKFVSALLFLNYEGARRLLNRNVSDFDIRFAAENSKRIKESIQKHIEQVNKELNHWEQIKKWILIPDNLTTESGLLTPTLKLRRTATEKKYIAEIEALYK